MRHLALLALVVPALALAQPTTGGGIKANCPTCVVTHKTLTLAGLSSTNVLKILQGALIDLNSGTDTATITFDGTSFVFSSAGNINSTGFGLGAIATTQGMSASGSSTIIRAANGGTIYLQNTGGSTFGSFADASVVIGTATTTKPVQIAGGSGAFIGTCAMAAGTTCTATVPSSAKCVCAPSSAGTASCVGAAVSATTVTITASASNSQTWNIICL